DCHPRFRESNLFHQQTNCFHEIVIVQEGFTHSHEDDIHALAFQIDGVIAQSCKDLSNNFARGEIALYSKQCREAELTIDCTANLRGHANRRARASHGATKLRSHEAVLPSRLCACNVDPSRVGNLSFRI